MKYEVGQKFELLVSDYVKKGRLQAHKKQPSKFRDTPMESGVYIIYDLLESRNIRIKPHRYYFRHVESRHKIMGGFAPSELKEMITQGILIEV